MGDATGVDTGVAGLDGGGGMAAVVEGAGAGAGAEEPSHENTEGPDMRTSAERNDGFLDQNSPGIVYEVNFW